MHTQLKLTGSNLIKKAEMHVWGPALRSHAETRPQLSQKTAGLNMVESGVIYDSTCMYKEVLDNKLIISDDESEEADTQAAPQRGKTRMRNSDSWKKLYVKKRKLRQNAPQVITDVMDEKRCCKKAVHSKLLLNTLHHYNTLAP